MKCCGQERKSTFCPVCGERLSNDGLKGLLLYLTEKKEMAEKRFLYRAKELARFHHREDAKKLDEDRGDHFSFIVWCHEVEEAIKQKRDKAAVFCDWLEENATEENNFLEAARALRKAFE